MTKLPATLLLLCSLAASARTIAAEPKPETAIPQPKVTSTTLDLEFDGATLAEAVAFLNKAPGGANIVLAGGPVVENRRLPRMNLRNCKLKDVLYTLQSVAKLDLDTTYDRMEDGDTPIFILKPLPPEDDSEFTPTAPPAPSVLPIGVGALIDAGMRFEDVQASVQATWGALAEAMEDRAKRLAAEGLPVGDGLLIQPRCTFHAGSRLLIVTGDAGSIACAREVVEQMLLNLAIPIPSAPNP
jgi:hypothetical protein